MITIIDSNGLSFTILESYIGMYGTYMIVDGLITDDDVSTVYGSFGNFVQVCMDDICHLAKIDSFEIAYEDGVVSAHLELVIKDGG